jgi:TonB family protein
MLAAAAAFASEPLMVRVAVYQRTPNSLNGDPPEPESPGTLLPAPQGGWPSSFDAVQQVLAARKKGRFNVMLSAVHAPKPLSADTGAAFFIDELGRAVEVKVNGENADVLLPNGKRASMAAAPHATNIFGAADERIYVAVTLLPPAEANDDVVVVGNGIRPLRLLTRVEPKYPLVEAFRNQSGNVMTQIRVEPDGSVSNVQVLQKVQPQIDAATVDAIKQWRFEPPTRYGKPVVAYVTMMTLYNIE